MDVEFLEGFDTFNTSQLARRYPLQSGCNIVTGLSGSGGALLNQADTSSSGIIPLTSRSAYIFGFDFKCTVNSQQFFVIYHGASAICTFTAAVGGALNTTFGNSA